MERPRRHAAEAARPRRERPPVDPAGVLPLGRGHGVERSTPRGRDALGDCAESNLCPPAQHGVSARRPGMMRTLLFLLLATGLALRCAALPLQPGEKFT